MLSVTIAIFGVLIGLLCGLLTRLAGSIGLLFLLFLLSVVGDGDFSAEKIYFWILAGSALSHSMPYSVTQRLLDWILGIRLRRISRKHQQQPHEDRAVRDESTPNDFWESVESLNDAPKDTEPMSNEFWDAVESSTKKTDTESDDSSSHT